MKPAIPVLLLFIALSLYLGTRNKPEMETAQIPASRREIIAPQSGQTTSNDALNSNSIPPASSDSPSTNASQVSSEKEIEALMDASQKSDSDSFQLIVAALADGRSEIRDAALEAAMQFGSRDAIPFLEKAASSAANPREKVKFMDAIDYLKMPTLGEIRTRGQKASSRN